jgi:Amt family ammonium transporter
MKHLFAILALLGAVTCGTPAWAEEKAAAAPVATAVAEVAEAAAAPAGLQISPEVTKTQAEPAR